MKKIRLSKSSISELEKNAVSSVLEQEYLGMGVETMMFEEEIASYLGLPRNCVASVNTGTSALHIALSCLGITRGDEVLVPSLTYVASFQAITAVGATPVACEVVPGTLFLDPIDLEKKITRKSKVIMPVHYASSSKGIDAIYAIAEKYGLRVIEDAAQSFGSRQNGMKVGSTGDIICFSFDGIKNITCGEGGAVVSSDMIFMSKVCDARLLGVKKDTIKRFSGERSWDFEVEEQGFRYHLSNINAAIGRTQLSRLEQFQLKRKEIAKVYCDNLVNFNEISLLNFNYDELMSHIFVVLVEKRDQLRQYLLDNNIEVGIHYKPNHMLKRFSNGKSLPITEELYSKLLTLPCHVDLTIEEQARVIQKIGEFYE